MSRARLLTIALLASAATCAHAQYSLPPGTSSSLDDTPRTAAPADTAAIAAAEAKMAANDWTAAVAILRPLTEKNPKNAHALYDLGFSLEPLHDDAGATAAYTAAAAADPAAIAPRVSLGLLLARNGSTPAATKLLREAVALPEDNDTRDAKAQAYRALARLDLPTAPDKSRDELIAAIKLSDETPPDVLLGGEIAEALHDDAAAEQAYSRALRINHDDPDVKAAYVRVLVREGKLDAAKAALTSGLQQHPASAPLQAEQATLLIQQKNYTEAIPLLESIHGHDPSNTAAARLLARAYVASGSPAKADDLFTQLLQANPTDGQLQAEWGDSLIRQKRNTEAQRVLTAALQSTFPTPQDRAQAAGELAFAAATNHDYDTVLRAATIRNAVLPPDAPTAFLLATAHDSLHHTRQAQVSYREFLELAAGKYPDEEWQAQQRLQTLSRAK